MDAKRKASPGDLKTELRSLAHQYLSLDTHMLMKINEKGADPDSRFVESSRGQSPSNSEYDDRLLPEKFCGSIILEKVRLRDKIHFKDKTMASCLRHGSSKANIKHKTAPVKIGPQTLIWQDGRASQHAWLQ